MGAAEILVQEDINTSEERGYSFTTVIMDKNTGEILKTIKYKQVLITLEERDQMEENIGYEKDHVSH
jgi:hypothetical protein